MKPFVDYTKRSILLPDGCKDLADVLKLPDDDGFSVARQFLILLLVETQRASELVIGAEPEIGGVNALIRYKVGETWHDLPFDSDFRLSIVMELQRMAGLSSSMFPSEGILTIQPDTTPMSWKVRMADQHGECVLTRIHL